MLSIILWIYVVGWILSFGMSVLEDLGTYAFIENLAGSAIVSFLWPLSFVAWIRDL